MNKNRKQAEWVDTNNEVFYVAHKFHVSVTNRYWLFWANLRKGWRKILNLANEIAHRNRLSVVFLYGEIKNETLTNYLSKLNNRQLIVLRADYINELSQDKSRRKYLVAGTLRENTYQGKTELQIVAEYIVPQPQIETNTNQTKQKDPFDDCDI